MTGKEFDEILKQYITEDEYVCLLEAKEKVHKARKEKKGFDITSKEHRVLCKEACILHCIKTNKQIPFERR